MAENIPMPEGPKRKASKKELSEILELKERINKLESQLKKEGRPEKKEEMVKQEIKTYLKELQQTPAFASPVADRDEAKEVGKLEPDQQVGALISLVFEKGLPEAISVAKNLDNPAILDEFHDTLVDHYYKTLIEKGVL
ncbi:MAG TPA: hypothetical protein ENL27_02930 [Candidatus Parcubacteria bacterium]|nr:hypothetical protein [Candidatus Parcubacteria bacterium]